MGRSSGREVASGGPLASSGPPRLPSEHHQVCVFSFFRACPERAPGRERIKTRLVCKSLSLQTCLSAGSGRAAKRGLHLGPGGAGGLGRSTVLHSTSRLGATVPLENLGPFLQDPLHSPGRPCALPRPRSRGGGAFFVRAGSPSPTPWNPGGFRAGMPSSEGGSEQTRERET